MQTNTHLENTQIRAKLESVQCAKAVVVHRYYAHGLEHVIDISAGQIQSGFEQSNLGVAIWRLPIQIWKVRLKSRFDHATQQARKRREQGGRAHAARPTQPTARRRLPF